MPVSYSADPETRVIELVINGKVTQEDWDAVVPEFESFMEDHGPIRLIEVVESLTGFEPSLIWEGIKFDFKAIPNISHCAVVTDIAWMSPLTKAAAAVMPLNLRVFPLKETDEARRWVATAS